MRASSSVSGPYLVRSGRAAHDGIVVLLIESVFLLDATLLSAECVTTDREGGHRHQPLLWGCSPC